MAVEPSEYKVRSTSPRSAIIETPLPLDDPDECASKLTRRIVRAMIVQNESHPGACVKISIQHQRRASLKGDWEDADSYPLTSLPAGKEVRLDLSSSQTLRLYRRMQELYLIGDEGVPWGEEELIVAQRDQALLLQNEASQNIQRLAEELGESFWEIIEHLDADSLKQIALLKLHESRLKAIQAFQGELVNEATTELRWQNFFKKNPWIFGYGLSYQFLSPVESQPHYGGTQVNRSGGQQGDSLLASDADVRFTVLVEIKKPNSLLVTESQYRNGVYQLGHDLIGGVAQLQANCRTWDRQGSRQEDNVDNLEGQAIYTCQPKGILVIGHTQQLEADRAKRQTFELFRQNLHNPEIITFDELLSRAKFIVSNNT